MGLEGIDWLLVVINDAWATVASTSPTTLIYNTIFYILLILASLQTVYPILMIIAMAVRQFSPFYHFFHKVEERSMKHGGDLVAQVLKSHGVDHVFTLSGGHISPILVGAEKLGIKIVDTRHEVTTVFAADAVARLSGIPGVAVVTAGPGVTNTVTAVKNAQMAESPVVLLGGSAATLLKGRGSLQDIDQLSLLKSVTKWSSTVTRVRDIIPTVREAFKQAQSNTPGPVFVELPLDVLYPYSIVCKEFVQTGSGSGKSWSGKIIAWYLNQYVRNSFAGAFEEAPTSPLLIDVTLPKKSQVQSAANMIRGAKKPLLILGSQSTLPPVGADSLREAIEQLGIPTYLGGMARGLLGRKSPINMRQARRDALKEADCVILGGAVPDFRLSYGRVLPKNAKIITVNRSKEQMLKNSKIFWNPSLAIQADVGQFFTDLASELNGFTVDQNWISTLRQRDDDKEKAAKEQAIEEPEEHLNPLAVLHKLEEELPESAVMVADGGDFVGSAAYILRPRAPLRWLDPGAFGTLGCGAGFALGAKLCYPQAEVVCIFGDGSFGYSLAEMDTFARFNIPILAIVGNDAGWTQIAREQKPMLGSDVACRLAYTDYEKAAAGLGAIGFRMDKAEKDKIQDIFREARAALKQGKPVVVNCLLGKSKFRDGSISV